MLKAKETKENVFHINSQSCEYFLHRIPKESCDRLGAPHDSIACTTIFRSKKKKKKVIILYDFINLRFVYINLCTAPLVLPQHSIRLTFGLSGLGQALAVRKMDSQLILAYFYIYRGIHVRLSDCKVSMFCGWRTSPTLGSWYEMFILMCCVWFSPN